MYPETTNAIGPIPGKANPPPDNNHSSSSRNANTTPSQQFIVGIGVNGVASALKTLDEGLRNDNRKGILSRKKPSKWIWSADWMGRRVARGQIGLIDHAGHPKIVTEAGRYPRFPLRNWWHRSWKGVKELSDTTTEFLSLTIVQPCQNQVVILSDPDNKIMSAKFGGGFVALPPNGSYDVIAVVDQTHLQQAIKDKITGSILGWTHEVKMKRPEGSSKEQEHVVAIFLDIIKGNCAIVQRGDRLIPYSPGQYVITEPHLTLRGLFTFGECHHELNTREMFTRDQVPVTLTVHLKWRLSKPEELVESGYTSPFDVVWEKAQFTLAQLIAQEPYFPTQEQQHPLPIDRLQTRLREMLLLNPAPEGGNAVLIHGVELRDIVILSRQFRGDMAATMEKVIMKRWQAQGDAEVVGFSARAESDAIRLRADAEANAVRVRALADGDIADEFSRETQLRRLDVQRIAAYGSRTTFVPTDPGLAPQAWGGLGLGAGLAAAQDH